jgi:hypothetical protein
VERIHTYNESTNVTDSKNDKPKVVFIAGTPRSGSTLLGNALGEMTGCFHGGELSFIFGQFDGGNRICGCGHTIDECAAGAHGSGELRPWCPRICGCGKILQKCDLWQAIQREAFGAEFPDRGMSELGRFTSTDMKYRPKSLLSMRSKSQRPQADGPSATRYAEALGDLYRAVAKITGAQTIVDSSKLAMHVDLGANFSGLDAHVIHLVRDPRALAHNWDRRNNVEGISKPYRVAVHWLASNLVVQALDGRGGVTGFTRLRYEDFVRAPRTTLERLGQEIGVDGSSLPFLDATTLHMEVNHGVAGSGSRFKVGDVKLVPDEEWRRQMSKRDLMLATVLTAPLLRRYGYSLLVR